MHSAGFHRIPPIVKKHWSRPQIAYYRTGVPVGALRLLALVALHKKSVGAVSDRDNGLLSLPRREVTQNRRRRRLLQIDFLCKAGVSMKGRKRWGLSRPNLRVCR